VFLQPAFDWLRLVIWANLQVRLIGDGQEFGLRSSDGYHDHKKRRAHLVSQRQPDQCNVGSKTMMPGTALGPAPVALTVSTCVFLQGGAAR
jgi:hypothetical protein